MRYRIGLGIVLAAAIGVYFLYPQRLTLEIVNDNTEQLMLCAQMADGEEFVLSFIHSVNKRPVYDTLRAEKGRVVVVKSRFDAFGAGMPETSTEQGILRLAKDGWLEWTTNRPLPEVTVRVGRVANHTLHLKGRSIPLTELARPGAALTLQTRQRSPYTLWKERCIR